MDSGRGVGGYRMPESLSAFCSIVSLTAAKTSRMFDVSVACVRLRWLVLKVRVISDIKILLRVEVEMRTIDLIESPEQVFRGAVDIVAA